MTGSSMHGGREAFSCVQCLQLSIAGRGVKDCWKLDSNLLQ